MTKPATVRWTVTWLEPEKFHAYRLVTSNGMITVQNEQVKAHCKWCAKLKLIKEHGGKVDMRGAVGPCAEKLREHMATST